MPTPLEKILELVEVKRKEKEKLLHDNPILSNFFSKQHNILTFLKDNGVLTAEDNVDRDTLEDMSEFYKIDFEALRKLPLEEFTILMTSYLIEGDPKKTMRQSFIDPEVEQQCVDFIDKFIREENV